MASTAMRRLAKELKIVEKQRNPQVTVRPSSKTLLEWHFVLHDLPSDSVYKDGYYHGKLLFTEQYPMSPPSVLMVTPSGRFVPYIKLCLTMTNWQPETWNPAWTVDTILVGLISFMVDVQDPAGVGVIHATADRRRRLASSSQEFNRKNPEFCELFPEFASPEPSAGVEDGAGARPPAGEEDSPVSESPAAPALATGDPATPVHEAAPPPAVSTVGAEDTANEQRAGKAEVGHTAPADDDEGGSRCATECWICFEDGAHEPLIHPCACRGSMSGVHASCVQDWINKHRVNAVTGELPNCGVCHKAYPGRERRPGPWTLAKQLLRIGFWLGLRLGTGYNVTGWYLRGADRDAAELGTWKRLQLTLPAAAVFLYQALLLAFSLPYGHPPPPKFLARIFLCENYDLLLQLGFQMLGYLVAGCYMCTYGDLEWAWFLPYTVLPLLPIISLYRGLHPTEFSTFLSFLFLGPFWAIRFIAMHPRLCLNPADAPFHVFIVYLSMPVCWLVDSSTPALVIVAVHCGVLFVALLEKIAVRKKQWEECDVWWMLIPLTAFSAYNMVLCYATLSATPEDKELVRRMSKLWFALMTTLALIINRARGVKQYHAWQNRHGSFEFQWEEAPVKAAKKGGPAPAGVAAEQHPAPCAK